VNSAFSSVSYEDYGIFLGGVVVGGGVVLGSNTDNTCVASICALITDSYSIYHYLNDYMNTNNQLDIAYGMTYLVEAFNSGFNVECTSSSFSTPLTLKQ
jgi:hypothetical protein